MMMLARFEHHASLANLCGPCWETISNSLNKVIYVTYHKSIKLGNPRYNSHKLGEPVKLFRNMPKTVWFIFPRRQLGESKAIVAVHWWFPWVPCLPCRPLPLKIQKHKDKDTTCFKHSNTMPPLHVSHCSTKTNPPQKHNDVKKIRLLFSAFLLHPVQSWFETILSSPPVLYSLGKSVKHCVCWWWKNMG